MPALLHQRHYRFGVNSGTESTHGWHGDIDTPVVLPTSTSFLLRFAVWEEGAAPVANALNTYQQFQCRKNAGAWQNITTTSTICRAITTTVFTNGQTTTQQLGAHGTFESSNAGCTHDGSSGGNQNDIPASGSSETEACLQLQSADLGSGDVVDFRLTVTYNTSLTTIVYDVTPSLTVNEPSASESGSPSRSPSLSESRSPSLSPSGSESVSPSLSESPSPSLSESASVSLSESVSESASPSAESPAYGRPSQDLDAGSWTPSSGLSLFAMVNEEDVDDLTYIRSGVDPTDDTAKLRLTGLILPGPGTVTIRIRGKWTGGV